MDNNYYFFGMIRYFVLGLFFFCLPMFVNASYQIIGFIVLYCFANVVLYLLFDIIHSFIKKKHKK